MKKVFLQYKTVMLILAILILIASTLFVGQKYYTNNNVDETGNNVKVNDTKDKIEDDNIESNDDEANDSSLKDDNNDEDNNDEDNNDINEPSDNNQDSSTDNSSNNDSNSNSNEDNGEGDNLNVNDDKEVTEEDKEDESEDKPVEINYKEENAKVAQEIIDLYRVSVLYDSKAFYTHIDGTSAVKTSDKDAKDVNVFLNELKIALGNIPQKIYDTLRMSVGLNIHILKDLPGGTSGYAIYQPYGSFRMVLDVDANYVDRIFYHELFHLMDRYMYHQNGRKWAFEKWESFNPEDFSYGQGGTDYTWIDYEIPVKDMDFVSVYAKSNALEDRADLFADLMFRSTKKTFMNKGYGINEKAIYLSQEIEKYFGYYEEARWNKWISF